MAIGAALKAWRAGAGSATAFMVADLNGCSDAVAGAATTRDSIPGAGGAAAVSAELPRHGATVIRPARWAAEIH